MKKSYLNIFLTDGSWLSFSIFFEAKKIVCVDVNTSRKLVKDCRVSGFDDNRHCVECLTGFRTLYCNV